MKPFSILLLHTLFVICRCIGTCTARLVPFCSLQEEPKVNPVRPDFIHFNTISKPALWLQLTQTCWVDGLMGRCTQTKKRAGLLRLTVSLTNFPDVTPKEAGKLTIGSMQQASSRFGEPQTHF
jgi:hypothetical protein